MVHKYSNKKKQHVTQVKAITQIVLTKFMYERIVVKVFLLGYASRIDQVYDWLRDIFGPCEVIEWKCCF